MRRLIGLLLAVAALCSPAPTIAQQAAPTLAQQAAPLPFKAFQAEPGTWPAGTWAGWKNAFLQPDGRIIDNGNGGISHSEGQGYGMLLAVLADDQPAFQTIYDWTRKELHVRGNSLAAWKWEPDKTPNVTDRNNASDGDMLMAWALVEAAERWNKPDYLRDAGKIATELDAATGIRSAFGRVMLPGIDGFKAEHREKEQDGPVVNLSYWVFPALERLGRAAPKVDWEGYRASGYTLLKATRLGTANLSPDWISIKNGKIAPALGFPPTFSYNAVRIPLYLIWARRDAREFIAPYVAHYEANGDRAFEYDVEKSTSTAEMGDAGYRAIFALAKCSLKGEQIPLGLRSVSFDRYYSTSLHMLALAAARLRSDKCL